MARDNLTASAESILIVLGVISIPPQLSPSTSLLFSPPHREKGGENYNTARVRSFNIFYRCSTAFGYQHQILVVQKWNWKTWNSE